MVHPGGKGPGPYGHSVVKIPHHLGPAERLSHRWWTVVQAATFWAISQEEAPLFPPLSPGQMWQRTLLAAWSWLGLWLCALLVRVVIQWWQKNWLSVLPCCSSNRARHVPKSEEVTQHNEVCQHAGVLGVSMETSLGLHIPVVNALMEGLLAFLLSEFLETPSPTHIQALAGRLERVAKALQRVESPVKTPPEGKDQMESQVLIDKLSAIISYLQQRSRGLQALLRPEVEFKVIVQEAQEMLACLWAQLEVVHSRIAVQKEGGVEICAVLREVERLAAAAEKHKPKLQECQTHLMESKHLLQMLESSQRDLGESVGVTAESHWTQRLIQSKTMQFEEISQSFLAVEHLLVCLRMHLEGLKEGEPSAPPPLWPPAPPGSSQTAHQSALYSILSAADCLGCFSR